jgi:hypothetical protein
MGVSGQRHAPAALYPREKGLRYALDRGWVGPRAGLDTEAPQNPLKCVQNYYTVQDGR